VPPAKQPYGRIPPCYANLSGDRGLAGLLFRKDQRFKELLMRKGWKTRIDERRYFEEKREQQEELAVMHRFMQQKMDHDIQMRLKEMRENNEIN
jgi:hypothetical protein